MKLQKTTWILVTAAILLGGVVYFHEIQGKPQREEIQEEQNKIFNFQANDIQILTIKTKQQTIEFERTKEPNKVWQMKQPENVPANDAVVSFLLNLLVSGKSDRSFTIPLRKLQDYGLDNPSVTIEIQLKNQQIHQLILGSPDFKGEFLYAQIDPPVKPDKEIKVSLVSQEFITAVEKKLEEWKQP
jgi:hypothetical protein